MFQFICLKVKSIWIRMDFLSKNFKTNKVQWRLSIVVNRWTFKVTIIDKKDEESHHIIHKIIVDKEDNYSNYHWRGSQNHRLLLMRKRESPIIIDEEERITDYFWWGRENHQVLLMKIKSLFVIDEADKITDYYWRRR